MNHLRCVIYKGLRIVYTPVNEKANGIEAQWTLVQFPSRFQPNTLLPLLRASVPDAIDLAHATKHSNHSIFVATFNRNVIEFSNEEISGACVTSAEFKRWLTKQGCTFAPGKGSHLKVFLGDRQSVLPMHAGEMKTGTVEGIKKQLGLK